MKKKLLFIPGYFGSVLRDRKTNELRWVRITDFLSNDFDLQMSERDRPLKNDLINSEILLNVKLIPKLLEIESYGKTVKNLQKFCDENNRELHIVTYDWRDDFHASILKIASKIKELISQNNQKIEVVAHSNGGLLISYYLRYGDQDFENAVENWEGTNNISALSIVASPLHGAFSIFKHIQKGTPVLKNKKLMSSLDYTSFKSTYFLLPPIEFQKGYLIKKGDEFQSFNLFDINTWKKNSWGPYIIKHYKELPVNDVKFKKLLLRAQKFHELLQSQVNISPQDNLNIQVIQGYGRPTFFYPTFKNKKSIKEYHYPRLDRIDGDGVVTKMATAPLHWFQIFNLKNEQIKGEHLKIMAELKHQKSIHRFLLNHKEKSV
jgi:hypothetical protein